MEVSECLGCVGFKSFERRTSTKSKNSSISNSFRKKQHFSALLGLSFYINRPKIRYLSTENSSKIPRNSTNIWPIWYGSYIMVELDGPYHMFHIKVSYHEGSNLSNLKHALLKVFSYRRYRYFIWQHLFFTGDS